jgi:hypothetical protein
LFLVAVILMPGCAATRKNTYLQKKAAKSHINTSQLGRNKYFFSPQYQKKLYKFKKK